MAINEKKWGSQLNKQLQNKKAADGLETESDLFTIAQEKLTCCTPPVGMKERVLQYVFGEKSYTQN
ncbi:hypothetical protein [Marinococcus halophilus]|uniref:hypothetical protein n=1 Tax=Marinococcus halophilus TaxID=1371 RepID=UPI0009A6B099|nr:hypothetical protein [Marinococcus halophilus]